VLPPELRETQPANAHLRAAGRSAREQRSHRRPARGGNWRAGAATGLQRTTTGARDAARYASRCAWRSGVARGRSAAWCRLRCDFRNFRPDRIVGYAADGRSLRRGFASGGWKRICARSVRRGNERKG
jgi:hypothetical protein